MAIDKELLDILACPKCKGSIFLNESQDGIICESCQLLYPIEDDIPIMLIEEAREIRLRNRVFRLPELPENKIDALPTWVM